VVGRRDQVAEHVESRVFELAREAVVVPALARQALRAGAVALQQQRTGECELSLGGDRSFLAEEGAHESRIEAVRP